MLDNKWLTIEEATEIIGCTPSYVRFLLRKEHLAGKKLTERTWIVDEQSAKKFAESPKKTGRPRTTEK
jgi:hypothetical protein